MARIASAFRFAAVQLKVGGVKEENVKRAAGLVAKAAKNGANVVALPECFNSPYGNQYFPEYAETVPGPTTQALSDMARDNKVFLIGGSIPEKFEDKIYNCLTVYDPEGAMVGKFRKLHLFDIDVPGKIRFIESETLSPGSQLLTIDTPYCRIGIGICYDIRFAELAQIYAQKGCHMLVYPGAFNMTTGPAHWELLSRARALDNQLYVGVVSPARDESATYHAWGHSSVVSPWGEVVATTEADEDIVYADIDPDYVAQVRQQIPIRNQKRHDLYKVEEVPQSQ